ncbi:hypothetical protein HUJ05_009003 [Dendroctonus ponderosae]|nr:hypothetical protein HUJ05_009003 [Dendroctonus ponderosae]
MENQKLQMEDRQSQNFALFFILGFGKILIAAIFLGSWPTFKIRSLYQPSQIRFLEKQYIKTQYVTLKQRWAIAKTLGLTERQVQVWFQNRRRRGTPRACVDEEPGTKPDATVNQKAS